MFPKDEQIRVIPFYSQLKYLHLVMGGGNSHLCLKLCLCSGSACLLLLGTEWNWRRGLWRGFQPAASVQTLMSCWETEQSHSCFSCRACLIVWNCSRYLAGQKRCFLFVLVEVSYSALVELAQAVTMSMLKARLLLLVTRALQLNYSSCEKEDKQNKRLAPAGCS